MSWCEMTMLVNTESFTAEQQSLVIKTWCFITGSVTAITDGSLELYLCPAPGLFVDDHWQGGYHECYWINVYELVLTRRYAGRYLAWLLNLESKIDRISHLKSYRLSTHIFSDWIYLYIVSVSETNASVKISKWNKMDKLTIPCYLHLFIICLALADEFLGKLSLL